MVQGLGLAPDSAFVSSTGLVTDRPYSSARGHCYAASELQIVSCSPQGLVRGSNGDGAINVCCHFYFGCTLQADENLTCVGARQLLALVVNTARPFFERIVAGENVANCCHDRVCRREHQKRCERAMI